MSQNVFQVCEETHHGLRDSEYELVLKEVLHYFNNIWNHGFCLAEPTTASNLVTMAGQRHPSIKVLNCKGTKGSVHVQHLTT